MAVRPASDDSIGSSPLANPGPKVSKAAAAVPDGGQAAQPAVEDRADTVQISAESRRRLELAQSARQARSRALSNAIPTATASRRSDALPVFEEPGPPDRRPRDPEPTPSERAERTRDASAASERRRDLRRREDVRAQNRPTDVRDRDDDIRQAERRKVQFEDRRRDRARRGE